MPNITQDLRIALRSLAKTPAVTLAVVLSLALGIGANTVVFSLIDTLLLRPLPGLSDPDTLVALYATHGPEKKPGRVTYADYLDLVATEGIFSGFAAAATLDLSLTRQGPSERVSGLAVSDNYFQLLGVGAAAGRLPGPGDGSEAIAVISHGLWQKHFGADPEVIGRSVQLNGTPMTIIGVTAREFRGTAWTMTPDVWVTLEAFENVATGIYAHFAGGEDRKRRWLNPVARLAPGITVGEAQAALDLVAGRLTEAYPETNKNRGVLIDSLSEVAFGTGQRQKISRYTGLLMALTGIVLLVACLDVASLLLARGLTRRRELAVRLSLGASAGRLVRLLLVESLTLAAFGGVAGLIVAGALMPTVERLKLPVTADFDLQLDVRVLVFAFAISVLCGVLFGLVPAWRSVRTEVVAALRGEVPVSQRWRLGSSDLLVTVQVALALVVLIGSGLMVRTLLNLRAIDPGYDPQRTLATSLNLSQAGYSGSAVTVFYQDLTDRLRRIPQVESASMASALRMMGAEMSVDLMVSIEDAPPLADGEKAPSAFHALVGKQYFETVGIQLLQGRDFNRGDTEASPGVIIVNQTLAREFWPDQDPLGRRLTLMQAEAPFEVVGVVSDTKYMNLKEDLGPILYLFHGQQEKSFLGPLLGPDMTLLLHTAGPPRDVLPSVRAVVRAMDPQLPVYNIKTLSEILSATVAIERQAALLFSVFALLAVGLVMIGLYGVVSQAVSRRLKEVGIRMACGARPQAVLRLILQRSMISSLVGIVVGLGAAVVASQALASYLYGVTRTDPATLAIAALVLLAITLTVAALPARRAARLDPITVLRED